MASDGSARKLAVILHADVVGSTDLVHRHEQLAHDRIQDAFQRFSETISRYGGVAHEIRGDALLAEYDRASDAVAAALAFQTANTEHNSALDDDIRPEVRIGISLGEVVIADGTLTGPDVVLAQRLEQLAEPGGVCISVEVQHALPGRLPYDYVDLGEQEVKGFDKPVRAYAVTLRSGEDIPAPEPGARVEKPAETATRQFAVAGIIAAALIAVGVAAWWQPWAPDVESSSVESPSIGKEALPLPDKPSIAVLPFHNISGDPKQDYFCYGLTEDLITALSKFSDLFVIARNSAFSYKGKQVSVKQVAEELGVRYVLEGSVRTIDQKVRITIQLADSEKADPLWAERYDRNMEDIFALQDEVTMQVLTALQVKLTEGEKIRALTRSTNDINAYLKWTEGRHHFLRLNREDNIIARQLLDEAIALDPKFSSPYVDLAYTNLYDIRFGISKSPKESLAEATRLANKAISLDESSPFAHSALGQILRHKRQYDKAIEQGQKAVALSPGDSLAMALLGLTLSVAGEYEESLVWMKKAIRQDPKSLSWYSTVVGQIYLFTGRYQEALKILKEVHEDNPKDTIAHLKLVAAYYLSGQEVEARAEAEKIMEQDPNFSTTKRISAWQLKNKSDSDFIIDVLRKAGLPD